MRVYLETERLLLRQFTAADVGNLVMLDGDPEVMRFLNGGTPTPIEVVRDEILPRILDFYDRFAGFGCWAAVEKSTGDLLGWFSLRPRESGPTSDVELGYRLRRSAWGQGYATEGSRALIRRAFAELGAERVFATTYGDNLASRRVMEKAGLRFERAFRLTPADLAATASHVAADDLWDGDDVEYALRRADWERREAGR